jgi:hypothetical protein
VSQQIPERNNQAAVRDALEQIGGNFAQLAQGIPGNLQLALHSRLAIVISKVGFERALIE